MWVCASKGAYSGTDSSTASYQGRRYSSAYTERRNVRSDHRRGGARMANDRLTGLDASFLHLEDDRTHMHVAGVMTFDGTPPDYDDVVEARSEEHTSELQSRRDLVCR